MNLRNKLSELQQEKLIDRIIYCNNEEGFELYYKYFKKESRNAYTKNGQQILTSIKGFEHIKSLKNVKELKCIVNDNGYIQCPISQEEFSGLNKFFFLWTCGCVYSKNAMDELNIKNKCINCDMNFDIKKDLISLNYNKKTKREILKSLLGIKNYNFNENNFSKDFNFDDNKKEIKLLNHKIKRNKDI